MEKRPLGKTGLETSLLGFGGFHLVEIPYSEAEFLLNSYLDAGGNYIETAASYGNGKSEIKIGKAVSHRRDDFILTTKCKKRTKEEFAESLNRSLAHLQTDHVDIIFMHAVESIEELYTILGPGGAMEGFVQAKREGKARFVGISMHGQPDVLIRAMTAYPFDIMMTNMNYYDRFNFPETEEVLVPLAHKQGTAVLLMKPLADGLLWRSPKEAFQYAFSRPVSTVVTGMNTREMLTFDLDVANAYSREALPADKQWYARMPELGTYVCRQCGRCVPCPKGIPIQEIFKYEGYFDRQLANGVWIDTADYALRERLRFWFNNKQLAIDRYTRLPVKADRCTSCGACAGKCPYGIDIVRKLSIADYKLAGKELF